MLRNKGLGTKPKEFHLHREDLQEVWPIVPWDAFPLSFKVDLCQFLAGIKPAVRTHVLKIQGINQFLTSMLDLGFYPILDNKSFLFISRDKLLSKRLMKVDNSPSPHAAILGLLLGYPKCCAKYIESVGEDEIDRIAENYNERDFKGPFSLIDITRYLDGIALISHVPCSTNCQSSLNIALTAHSFIKDNSAVKGYADWAKSVIDYF